MNTPMDVLDEQLWHGNSKIAFMHLKNDYPFPSWPFHPLPAAYDVDDPHAPGNFSFSQPQFDIASCTSDL